MLSHSPVRGAQTYRPDIDGLRAVAVGAVVLSHAGVPLMSGGFIGVDVFFVISGFLITQILQRELAGGEFSLIAFYERRVRRIFPALMVVIAATLIGGAVLVPPDALKDLTGSAVATAVFSSNLWLWRSATDYFGPGAAYQPLLHTWSLAVEEQFYIVYPLLLWWASRWSPRWTLPVLGMLTAASFATALIDTEQRPVAAFFLMPSRGWELGMGCLLALALARSSTPSTTSVLAPRAVREVLGAVSLTAIVAACMMYDETTPFPGTAALVPCLAAAALIGVGAHGGSLASRLLASRPFVSISLLSYSLYLWHWPLLAFVRIYRDNEDLPPTLALACVVTATGLAAITWALVERPVRSRSARPVTVFSFAGIATVAVVTVSLAGWHSGGFPTRFDVDTIRIYAAARDINPDQDRCTARDPSTWSPCRFGEGPADAPVSFLLWGDSHAVTLMSAANAAATALRQTGMLAGLDACPPLLGVVWRRPGFHFCASFNAAVLRHLNQRDDIKTVILAARWPLIVSGSRVDSEPGGPVQMVYSDRDTEGTPDNPTLVLQGLAATIDAVHKTGREVVIIGGVPEIGWRVPRRFGDAQRFGLALPPLPTIETVTQRQAAATSIIERSLTGGATHVPLVNIFCTPVCQIEADGRPLYTDSHHLSHFGAVRKLTPTFKALLGD